MFNTLFYPTTMNRKEYLIAQGNVQKDVSALAETLKTQLAVFPEAIKVGEIPCNETVQEKYKDKLQFIYSIAKNMFVPALVELLLDKTIVLAGEKEVPATFHGVATKTKIKKFALIME